MHPILTALARHHGVAPLARLVASGCTAKAVQRLAADGDIIRVRRGWYALPDADQDIVRAVRVGGRLACISACRRYGVWTPKDDRIHVKVSRQASNLKGVENARQPRTSRDGASVIHWSWSTPEDQRRVRMPSLITALADALVCQPADIAFAMVESALHRGMLSEMDRWELYGRVPHHLRDLVADAEELSESGTESLFRFRMNLLGIRCQTQVEIPGVGRVDFVIGDRLIVEIDSEGHHGSAAQRKQDLQRDAIAASLGYITLRFDYWQIMDDWETVAAAVLASVSSGDHLGRLTRAS